MRTVHDDELKKILKIMSPGTSLREGLDNILRAKTGGLIVLGDNEEILDLVDGGFNINSEYSPAYIYELAKMDGALVLTSDRKRILYANAQLMPNQSISTFETGTRHRTAESSYWHKSCKTRCSVCRCRHYGYGYCKSGTQRIYRCPQTACSGLHTDRPSGRHLHSEVQ